MNELATIPFTTPGGTELRSFLIDGEPWFVLADVCRILGISNPRDVAARLADDQKGVDLIDTPGGRQNTTLVNESGLYEVVIRSDKKEAVVFRRWITAEVLPAIRKTGGYAAAAIPAQLPSKKELAQWVIDAEQRAEFAEAKVAELEPKADLADTFLVADGGARLIREAAKMLGLKEKELRRLLLNEKRIFARHAPCGDVQYDHYAGFAHHFQARETVVNHMWGTCSHYTLYILPRGLELIRKRMTAEVAA